MRSLLRLLPGTLFFTVSLLLHSTPADAQSTLESILMVPTLVMFDLGRLASGKKTQHQWKDKSYHEVG